MINMPVIFIGHGSPMNAIENNEFTKNWIKIASEIPEPKAILSISAHWFTDGFRITDEKKPKTIYDMYGFPEKLYEIVYDSPGAPELAHYTKDLINNEVKIDNSWGYDHGTWLVLHVMYPEAKIPVFQMSVNYNGNANDHYLIGKQINELRQKGVLILGSGNVVHNLPKIDFNKKNGFEWAQDFDNYIKEKIINKKYDEIINYKNAGKSAELAFPSPDHFFPLLVTLGSSDENDNIKVFNDVCVMGSLSMTCYLFSN